MASQSGEFAVIFKENGILKVIGPLDDEIEARGYLKFIKAEGWVVPISADKKLNHNILIYGA